MHLILEILGHESVAVFIFCSLVPLACIGVLTNTNFTSGSATKVLAFLTFLVGVGWFVFGATLARRLNNGYTSFTPSGHFFKKAAKQTDDPEKSAKNMKYALGSALLLDATVANVMINNLPFPLNYFYYMGMWPIIPFLLFGAVPAFTTWMGLGTLVSLASVMDAGGDGTEYVEAKKIHWFYSLSPADRERVREGSDLEGELDSESDDESDEERGHAKRKGGAVSAH